MLPILQRLDPSDPIADDPRVALPATVAGFYAYRALLVVPVGADRDESDLAVDVYPEIARGVAEVDKRITESFAALGRGEISQGLADDCLEVGETAQVLLLHAVRHYDALRKLILQCLLGPACRKQEPFLHRPAGAGGRLARGLSHAEVAAGAAADLVTLNLRPVCSRPRDPCATPSTTLRNSDASGWHESLLAEDRRSCHTRSAADLRQARV